MHLTEIAALAAEELAKAWPDATADDQERRIGPRFSQTGTEMAPRDQASVTAAIERLRVTVEANCGGAPAATSMLPLPEGAGGVRKQVGGIWVRVLPIPTTCEARLDVLYARD